MGILKWLIDKAVYSEIEELKARVHGISLKMEQISSQIISLRQRSPKRAREEETEGDELREIEEFIKQFPSYEQQQLLQMQPDEIKKLMKSWRFDSV